MLLRDLSHLSVTVTRHYGISAMPGGDTVLWLEVERSEGVYILLSVCVVKKSILQSLECLWRKLSGQSLELFPTLWCTLFIPSTENVSAFNGVQRSGNGIPFGRCQPGGYTEMTQNTP